MPEAPSSLLLGVVLARRARAREDGPEARPQRVPERARCAALARRLDPVQGNSAVVDSSRVMVGRWC
jgi:hypothetical protein